MPFRGVGGNEEAAILEAELEPGESFCSAILLSAYRFRLAAYRRNCLTEGETRKSAVRKKACGTEEDRKEVFCGETGKYITRHIAFKHRITG